MPKEDRLCAYYDYTEHPEIPPKITDHDQGCYCLLKAPETGLWMYNAEANENFWERFRSLATRAGVTLDCPTDTNPEDFWLHRLYFDMRSSKSTSLSGTIDYVCEASATFCTRLERKALEGEMEKHEATEAQTTPSGNSSQHEQLSKWEDLEISFLSDERIQTRTPSGIKTFNYGDFDLRDRRNGKPNRAWNILRSLAENQGTLKQPPDDQKWPAVEKHVQEIRALLRERFSLQDDPLPFVSNVGYRAKFTVKCASSFET